MMLDHFEGLLAAPVSPMTHDGKLNLNIIEEYIDYLLNQGVKGVFLCGTTGEGHSLTIQERKALVEKWVECGKHKLDCIIVQCGCEQIENARELAKHAALHNVDGIACLPPTYFKPNSTEVLVKFLSKISEVAPATPFFYYHIPMMSGVVFDMKEFLKLATRDIPMFSGLKYSNEILLDFSIGLNFKGKQLKMFYGGDAQLLGALAMGSSLAIGSTYNYLGKPTNKMIQSFMAGDIKKAQELQIKIQDVILVLLKYGGHNGVQKAILQQCGLDVGPSRLPVLPLNTEEYQNLQRDLQEIDFFNFIKEP